MKILVVDDSELIRFRLVRQIAGIPGVTQVVTASGRRQAEYLVTTLHPAFVVLDLHLPDGDSADLIARFKSAQEGLKVAILTNDATDFNRQRCLQAGADGFYDKSTEFDQLIDRLNHLSSSVTPRRTP